MILRGPSSLRHGPAARTAGLACAVAWLASAGPVLAHGGAAHGPDEIWQQWSFDPLVVVPMLLGTGLYVTGLVRLWRRAGIGRGVSVARAGSFTAGLLVLVVALISPLDAWSEALFSVHMVQHLLLIMIAPPLLVVGAPDVAFLWALPQRWRPGFGRFEQGLGRSLGSEQGGRAPLLVVALTTGVLWAWHLPYLYDLAVRNAAVHVAEHAGFLVTALFFWTTVLRLRPRDHMANGLRVLYVFAMGLQGSILGALITFAARPLYASHMDTAPLWGMSPLADQQLAGLIMWVPPALLYIGVAAYLFVGWLDAIGARADR